MAIGAERPADEAIAAGDPCQQRLPVPLRRREDGIHHPQQLQILPAERDDTVGGAQSGMHAAVEHGEAERFHPISRRVEVANAENDLTELEHGRLSVT